MMSRCLYCYHELDAAGNGDYHPKCIKTFYGTKYAPALPYRLDDMEKLAKEAVMLSVTVPGVQPKLSLFNFLIGNNDMHLKNFSMWLSDIGWVLSPAYDLLNVKIILPKDDDDTALLVGGKKNNFNKGYFDRFGNVLKLNDKQIISVYRKLESWLPVATQLIDISFLNENFKTQYKELITQRARLFIQ